MNREDKKNNKDITIWQLYNSGVIIAAGGLIIGIDIVTGREVRGLRWAKNSLLAERLADTMDVLLVTHSHSDHMDTMIMKKMLKKDKLLFAPGMQKTRGAEKTLTVSGLDRTGYRNILIISRPGKHVYDPKTLIKNFYYEIILPGDISIVHTGDHDYSLSLRTLKRPNILIPKCCGISDTTDDITAMRRLSGRLCPDLIIPVHLLELGHPPGGGRFGFGSAFKTMPDSDFRPLFWGESVTIEKIQP